jgi:hypothetical protein
VRRVGARGGLYGAEGALADINAVAEDEQAEVKTTRRNAEGELAQKAK